MDVSKQINISEDIDNRPFGRFQVLVLVLCGLTVLLDGFDVQVIGFLAPAIIHEWNANRASLGPVFAASLFGLLIGSLVLGTLADKWGRRPVLIGATFFFSICMMATAHVHSLNQLMVMRFVTGLGLGSILPNVIALSAEYSPLRKRVTALMLVSIAFPIGAVLAGIVSELMLPHWGWRSVFYVGGVLPVILAVVLLFNLPESLQFLVLREKSAGVRRWLGKLYPEIKVLSDAVFIVREPHGKGSPVAELFTGGRASTTLMLWAACMANLLILYFISNWLPTIVRAAGLTLSNAVLAGTAFQIGGVVGAILLGFIIDRHGFRAVLIPCFIVAAVALFMMGRPGLGVPVLFMVIIVAGFCVIGGQGGLNALAASSYPTALRSTGIGWALGMGKLGSVLGPMLGGEFVKMGLPDSTIFLAAAVPAVVSALLIWGMRSSARTSVTLTPAAG